MSPKVSRSEAPYLQIAESIRRDIMGGVLVPGDSIPSERVLSEAWSVSRMTASKALGSLRSEGLIHSVQGKGTYVSSVPKVSAADRYGRSVNSLGKSYGPNESSEIRKIEIANTPFNIAEFLGISKGSSAISRYRIISDITGVLELTTAWFSLDLRDSCPDLLSYEKLPNGMLRYIAQKTGRSPGESRDTYKANILTSSQLADMQLDPQSTRATLAAEYRIYDTSGKPLVYVESSYRPGYALVQSVSLS